MAVVRQGVGAWFVGGLVAGVFVAPLIAGLVWVAQPALGVLVLVGLAGFTIRIRRGTNAGGTRVWSIWLWATVASLLSLAALWYVTPPGSGLPKTEELVGRAVPAFAILAVGSAVIAVAAREASRRWFVQHPAST